MSHTFSIRNVKRLPFLDTLNRLGISDLLLTEDSPQPVNDMWPEGDAYLYIDRISVRPIETSYTDGIFSARIFANSSPKDYDLAIKLVAEIARQNRATIEPEDNTALDADSFVAQYDSDWVKEHCTSMLRMLIVSYQREPTTFTLAGTVRNLQAGPRFFGQLLSEPATAVSEFYRRFRTLNYLESNDFYIADGIRLQNPSGDIEVVTSVYGPDLDTILSDATDVISVRCEGDENYFVTLEQLAHALGEKAVWLSETVLLAPAVSECDWNGLIEALKPVATTDIFAFGRPVDTREASENEGYRARFTDDEWGNLLYAPIVVFALMASADGSIDRREVRSFQQQLIQGLAADDPMMQQLVREIIPNLETLVKAVLEGDVEPKSVLESITASVDTRLSDEEAMHLKLSLMHIGKTVAESSGGLFGLSGEKISKTETQTLAELTATLKIGPLH